LRYRNARPFQRHKVDESCNDDPQSLGLAQASKSYAGENGNEVLLSLVLKGIFAQSTGA
jgi:hypothetical protein